VRLVVATALMAIARKVIVFDYNELGFPYVFATAAVLFSLGITYWLITRGAGERPAGNGRDGEGPPAEPRY
jgi:uncharacterized membrane protein (DUF373 family)